MTKPLGELRFQCMVGRASFIEQSANRPEVRIDRVQWAAEIRIGRICYEGPDVTRCGLGG